MGPLVGLKVVELAGLGAAPFCAMLLADLGADIIRIDRPESKGKGSQFDILNRGRRSITLDLKNPDAVATALRLVNQADILLEGFRPGVMERLGLGPEACHAANPRLVYGRMTGWGQEGPLAKAAGHDINYISLAGTLHAIGIKDAKPVPPLNLVGDYAGAMLMAFGLVAAVLEAWASGRGQVVDGSMLDAAALTMNRFFGLLAEGKWRLDRESNYLDGGAHFYDTYVCADGKYIAVGPIEPQFYSQLLEKLEVPLDPAKQMDAASWPEQKRVLADIIGQRTRDEWAADLDGTDVCVSPILDLNEAPLHCHNIARETFIEREGVTQAAPAPRFSRTPAKLNLPPPKAGQHNEDALARWGFSKDEIVELTQQGVFNRCEKLS